MKASSSMGQKAHLQICAWRSWLLYAVKNQLSLVINVPGNKYWRIVQIYPFGVTCKRSEELNIFPVTSESCDHSRACYSS